MVTPPPRPTFSIFYWFLQYKMRFFASNIFIKFKVLDQRGWPCTFLLLIFNIICLALKDTQYIVRKYMKLVFMIFVKMKHGMNITLFFISCS